MARRRFGASSTSNVCVQLEMPTSVGPSIRESTTLMNGREELASRLMIGPPGACAGRFWRDEWGRLYDRSSGQTATQGNQTDFLFRTCLQTGYTIGGGERVKAQATADLIQFLRDAEILSDAEARAIVPDCVTIPEGIHRRNCVRARNGWTGDLVALARAFRRNAEVRRDDALAARLFELAASRNHPQAQWELSIMLRQAGEPSGMDGAHRSPLASSSVFW